MKPSISALAAAFLLAVFATAADAQPSCSTVARGGQLDPDGQFYSNTFRSEVAINSAGNAMFVARPYGARDKLYFYPSAGAAQVIARADGPAPNGGTFRSQRAFLSLSVNDLDDLAFSAHLVSGDGVFLRDGGVLEAAAMRSQAAPSGGVFEAFPMVGAIDAASRVPFVARIAGGADGAFVYDSSTDVLASLVLDGAATLDGRQICSIQAVDLGTGSFATIRASSKLICSDASEVARNGIFIVTGLGISTVALDGDAAPIGGSVFARFLDTPRINASNDIAFRAKTGGTTKTDGVFVWDFATDTITTAVRKGDAVPVVGGSVAANQSFAFDDAGDVILNAKIAASSARFGILKFGAVDSTLLVKTDAPPSDVFGPGSTFVRFSTLDGTSPDGNRFALQVRVTDTAPPSAKGAVIRCAGSPSGAFIDGAMFF